MGAARHEFPGGNLIPPCIDIIFGRGSNSGEVEQYWFEQFHFLMIFNDVI
jgi:hypothetical protein